MRNLLLIVAALLIQSTLAELISIGQIKPDFVLIVLVFLSLSDGQIAGTIFGFLSGWFQDVYSPQYFGLNALCKSVVGFFVGYGSGGVIERNLVVQGIILFMASFFHDALYFLISSWKHMEGYGWYLLRFGVPTALYTTLVGVFIFSLLSIRRRRTLRYADRFVSR